MTADCAPPAADLAHTLLRWQNEGIEIFHLVLGSPAPARAISVRRPRMFRWAMYQVLTTLGLKRHLLGGFGGKVPHPSSG